MARIPDIMHMFCKLNIQGELHKTFQFPGGKGKKGVYDIWQSFNRYSKTNVQMCQFKSCSEGMKAFEDSYK